MLLAHGFLAQLACLVLWFSKPAFLSDHKLSGVPKSPLKFPLYLQSPIGISELFDGPFPSLFDSTLSLGLAVCWAGF